MAQRDGRARGELAAPGQISRLLRAWRDGDSDAPQRLIPLVYPELHRLAQQRVKHERAGNSLQPTAVVHEAYLRLVGAGVNWQDRAHFFAVAAQTMRRILVDHARTRLAKKREGGQHLSLLVTIEASEPRGVELLDLDAALTRLAEADPERARVVELRFFGGLTIEETAEALGRSTATVKRDWTFAKAFLHRELEGAAP